MLSYIHPGAQNTATDAVTWVFKDGGEPLQLLATLLLAALALTAWNNARKLHEKAQNE